MLALRLCLNVKIHFDIEPNMQISLSSEYEREGGMTREWQSEDELEINVTSIYIVLVEWK